jgi:predicted transcriptional regulator
MPRKPQDVTDAELAILQILWVRGPMSARDLTRALYPQVNGSSVATTQNLLKRLEAKDHVCRNRGTWPHVFTASVQRGDLIGRRLQITADDLCNGAVSPLLTYLVQSRRLSPAERAELRELLGELENQDPEDKPRG